MNQKLLDAAMACNFAEMERLLQCGADPLAIVDDDRTLLSDILDLYYGNAKVMRSMPKIMGLFLDYGMDLQRVAYMIDRDDWWHPMISLAHMGGEYSTRTLKVLLDRGVDVQTIEGYLDHLLTDLEHCVSVEDVILRAVACDLKNVMLVASYPEYLHGIPWLARFIKIDENNAELLPKFRKWRNFTCEFDFSTIFYPDLGTLVGGTVVFHDRKTKEAVWRFLI